jgi:S-(hydroxymethyl)glutathione dehydrogenase / alcohol dehydrogenase
MKAAVLREFGKPLTIEELEMEGPGENEVRVRLAATSICHSDIHTLKGEIIFDPLPLVAGHESAGVVERVGAKVTSVKPGDAVVVSVVKSCGTCHNCMTGLPHLCLSKEPPAPSPLYGEKGERFSRMAGYGGFAEYVQVHESQTAVIPKDMPFDRAALLACGVTTGFLAVTNRARVEPMRSVVVIGTGGVGLNCVQGAAFAGAYPVIAIDLAEKKLEAAKLFGATHTINSRTQDATAVVKELTGGRGADYVFVSVGGAEIMREGFLMSAPRGMTVILGLPPLATPNISVSVYDIVMMSERVITGAFQGSINLRVDIPVMVDLYKAGRLKLDELISGRYPLEKINEAVASAQNGETLKNVIMF